MHNEQNLAKIGQPNLWAALMRMVCDLLVAMFVVGSAFDSFLYQLGPFQFVSCCQGFLEIPPCLVTLITLHVFFTFFAPDPLFRFAGLVSDWPCRFFPNLCPMSMSPVEYTILLDLFPEVSMLSCFPYFCQFHGCARSGWFQCWKIRF